MPLVAADELYLVRVAGRGPYRVAHAHEDALPGLGAVCGARLAPGDWALEDAEVSRLRRRVLCARCVGTLRAWAANAGASVEGLTAGLTEQEVRVR